MEAQKPATDSPLKRLAVHASHYGITSLITVMAGLVSFPLLTRLFTVADYGVMNLIAATVSLSVALGKLGVQHSILRYHSEITSGKGQFTLPQLVATTFFGMVASGIVVVLLLVVGTHYAPLRWIGDERLRPLFAIASLLILVQIVESGLVNFLRAEQRTTAFMIYQVAKKLLTITAIVVGLLTISRTLRCFYSANVIAEGIAVGGLFWLLFADRTRPRPATAEFSRPLYNELIALGIPMMIGYEMSSLVLGVGDRYVIEGMIGEKPLGLYAAAYNLCIYVQQVAITSIGQAIMPLYMRMYDEKGVAETSSFITNSLTRYMLIAAPVVAGLAAVGPELLPSLASEKYASAAGILPWVIAGMVVDGSNAMLGAGLFIHRKTKRIMAVVMSGAIFNILLNIVLVPRLGIRGSAIATLVSYAGTALGLGLAGRALLPVSVRIGTLLRAGAAAGVMYLAVHSLFGGHKLLTVGVRTVSGGILYVAIMMVIDRDARALVGKVLARFRSSAARGRVRRVAIFAAGAVLALGAMELMVRQVYTIEYSYEKGYGRIFTPGTTVHWRVEGNGVAHYTVLGLRRPSPPDLSRPSLLAIGDSFTEAVMVDDDEAFPEQLETRLGGRFQVLNAGRADSSLADYVAYAPRHLRLFHPRWTIVELTDIDLAGDAWDKSGAHFVRKGDALEVVPRPELSLTWHSMNEAGHNPLRHIMLVPYAQLRRLLVAAQRGEAPLFHAGTVTEPPPPPKVDYPVEEELASAFAAYDQRLTVFYFSPYGAEESEIERRTRQTCETHGWSCVFLRQGFGELAGTGLAPYGFPDTAFNSGHPNRLGHRIAGELLDKEIRRLMSRGVL